MSKKPFPVPGLTKRQREVFELIAIGEDGGHHPKTIEVLIERGAIVLSHWETVGRDALGVIRIPRYAVPIPLHVKWCEWCEEREEARA